MKFQAGCFVVFLGMFYVIGFGLLGSGLWNAYRSTRARHWPTTQGSLTHLELKDNSGSESNSYRVEVRYAYSVHGVNHEGNRLAYGYSGTSNKAAEDAMHGKLLGAKSVTVRYNPSAPAESCLSYGLHRSIAATLICSTLWLVFVAGFTQLIFVMGSDDDVLLRNLAVSS